MEASESDAELSVGGLSLSDVETEVDGEEELGVAAEAPLPQQFSQLTDDLDAASGDLPSMLSPSAETLEESEPSTAAFVAEAAAASPSPEESSAAIGNLLAFELPSDLAAAQIEEGQAVFEEAQPHAQDFAAFGGDRDEATDAAYRALDASTTGGAVPLGNAAPAEPLLRLVDPDHEPQSSAAAPYEASAPSVALPLPVPSPEPLENGGAAGGGEETTTAAFSGAGRGFLAQESLPPAAAQPMAEGLPSASDAGAISNSPEMATARVDEEGEELASASMAHQEEAQPAMQQQLKPFPDSSPEGSSTHAEPGSADQQRKGEEEMQLPATTAAAVAAAAPPAPQPQPLAKDPAEATQEDAATPVLQTSASVELVYPHVPGASLLEVAELAEARLASGAAATTSAGGRGAAFPPQDSEETQQYRREMLMARLASQLDSPMLGSGSNSAGAEESLVRLRQQQQQQPAGSSTALGSRLVARAFISPQLESVFKASAADAAQLPSVPSVVAKCLGVVAVGGSSGTSHVLMPRPGRAPPTLYALQDRGAAGDAVASLALGQHGGGLLLACGHASGVVRLWETKPVGAGGSGGVTWALAKAVSGVHAAAVTACAVVGGGATTWVLTADSHGRMMTHNVNKHLSLTALALAGIARQWSAAGGAAAASSTLVSLQAAGQDPGTILSLLPLQAPEASQDQQQQQQSQPTLHVSADGTRFMLVVATRAVLLCALSDSGLATLHVFFPPPAMQGEAAAAYAAWRLLEGPPSSWQHLQQPKKAEGGAEEVVVAIAWGSAVSVLRAALTRPKAPSTPPRQPAAAPSLSSSPSARTLRSSPPSSPAVCQPLAAPVRISTWAAAGAVCALGFLGDGTLAVVTAAGEAATAIALWHPSSNATFLSEESSKESGGGGGAGSPRSSHLVEDLVVADWVVSRQLGLPGPPSFHGSLADGGTQLLLLTSRGVRVVHLMNWRQRLSALIAQQRLDQGLLCATRLVHSLSRSRAEIIAGSAEAWPADYAAPEDAEALMGQLLTVLRALVDSRLQVLAAPPAPLLDAAAAAERLADVAINACLLIGRPSALFEEVCPRFLASPFAAALLTALEPRILGDELPSVPPEVMQALVEHFVAAGQAHRVERCVLKLDILSLDLNQLIPLCLRRGLYGALVHIFNGAMQDYQTPAALLLVAAAEAAEVEGWQPASHEQQQQCSSPAADALEGSAALRLGFKLLVYLKGCFAGEAYPPGSGLAAAAAAQAARLHAATFLLHSTSASLLDTWNLWASVAHVDNGSDAFGSSSSSGPLLAGRLKDPAPALRFLCWMDAEAVLRVLRDGLAGWDALETDLVEASPEIAPLLPHSDSPRTVTQAAVDAVVALLEEQTAGQAESRPGAAAAREALLLRFVAEHLASNRASAQGAVLLRVLRFLARPDAQQQPLALPRDERESIFRDVVMHAAGPAETRAQALRLARDAGFLQAEARIHHADGAHDKALRSLAEDGGRHPAAPFAYLRDLAADPGVKPAERAIIEGVSLELMPQLVRIDAARTATTVALCFPGRQVAALEALTPWPDDQFAFLRAGIEAGRHGEVEGDGESTFRAGVPGSGRALPLVSLPSPLLTTLLHDKSVSALYVRLLCRFDPSAVLPFLQSSGAYDVDACLKHCLEAGVRGAAAFLLERRGDARGALEIYLQEVEAANEGLVAAVLRRGTDGLLPSAGTPPPPPQLQEYTLSAPSSVGAEETEEEGRIYSEGEEVEERVSVGHHNSTAEGHHGGFLEYSAAKDALRAAVAMCVRFTEDRAGVGVPTIEARGSINASDGAAVAGIEGDPVRAVWFEVLHRYLSVVRRLKREGRGEQGASGAAGAAGAKDLLAKELSEGEKVERLGALEGIFSAFMEEVVGQMAGHVPLQSVAAELLRRYSGDWFGDFRATLQSLVDVCTFELAILRCASRVAGTDAIALLKQGYRQCMEAEEGSLEEGA